MNPFPERDHSETLEQGDPTLLPEFMDIFEVGLTKNLNDGNSIFATGYSRKTKNLVNRVNTIFNDTILNRIYSNVGHRKSLSLEIGTQLKPTTNYVYEVDIFIINLSYTLNSNKNKSKFIESEFGKREF